MKKNIFIVVLVEYDYYRFQENLYADTNKEKCISWAKNYSQKQIPIALTEKTSLKKRL